MRTTLSSTYAEKSAFDTALTQKPAGTEAEPMKYPVKVKYRGKELAKIYKPSKAYPSYRVCWRVLGRRRMKAFATYSSAKRHSDELVEGLYNGSQVTALTPAQATDALAALEKLHHFYASTGRKVSLLTAVSEFAEAAAKLDGRTMGEGC